MSPLTIYLVVGCCAVVVFGSGVWTGRAIWRKPSAHPSLSTSAVRRVLDRKQR